MSKLRSPRLDCSMTIGTSCEAMSLWSISGDENGGREARDETGLEVGLHQRDREQEGGEQKQLADAAVEQHRPLHAVEVEDRLQDPPPIAPGRELRLRAFGARRVGGLDLADRHAELERVDAHLGLDLEAGGQHREALDEAAREDAVAREDVAEAAPEQPGEKAGEDPVPDHVAAAIGALLVVAAGA